MAGKLHIPSLDDMDKVKQLPTKEQMPSHFKSSTVLQKPSKAITEQEPSNLVKYTNLSEPNDKNFAVSTKTTSDIRSNGSSLTNNTKNSSATLECAAASDFTMTGSSASRSNATSVSLVPVSRGSADSTANKNEPNKNAAGDVQAEGTSTTDAAAGAIGLPSRPKKQNSIIVNSRQKGNPILKFIRRIPWEFGDISPDYQIGPVSCVLYLSLKYHSLNPNYIHERLKQLANSFHLRVLLVQVDVKDPHHSLKELAGMCILADCTLILAFTLEEAGRYLETYKSFENKPPDLIMEKTESNFLAKMTDVLTSAKKINKTDAVTLLSAFGSFEKLAAASEEDISLCPGLGPQKAQRLHAVLHQPFLKDVKKS
jgi:DNA excision repair protein ERCC-1